MVDRLKPTAVTYDAPADALVIAFGAIKLSLPLRTLAEFRGVRRASLSDLEVGHGGLCISSRSNDIDISTAGLVADIFGNLASCETGRVGGMRRSPKKAAAARKNGALGGRPKKVSP